MGEGRVSGFLLQRRLPIDDETVAKMGHPLVVTEVEVVTGSTMLVD
jgi:hypothetical protein